MLEFCGKAKPHGPVPFHPAAYHSLDVAACAEVLLEELPLVRQRLARLLDVEAPSPLLVAFIGLHDIGKFSAVFQFKPSANYIPPQLTGVECDPSTDEGMGATGCAFGLDDFIRCSQMVVV